MLSIYNISSTIYEQKINEVVKKHMQSINNTR